MYVLLLSLCFATLYHTGDQQSVEYKLFIDYYSRLEEILPAIDLCHYFVSYKIISVKEYDSIIRLSLPQDAARALLKRVSLQMQSGNSTIFNKMLLIMEYHGVIAAKLLSQEIRGKLMAPMFLDDLTSDGEQSKLYAIINVAISMHIL